MTNKCWITKALIINVSKDMINRMTFQTASTIPDIFSTAIVVYCMLCVISYYQTISENPPGTRHRYASGNVEFKG